MAIRGSTKTWDEAVKTARLAALKSFEGRMEAAKASFKAVPENGKDAEGRTLAEFAEEVDISYGSLDEYRRVWRWLGDFGPLPEIRSYSIAREAMKYGDWKNAKEFIKERDNTDLPDGFERWSVDAVRVGLLGKAPTNTGKVQQQAVESGEDAAPEEITAAHIEDLYERANELAEQIEEPAESRKVQAAAKKTAERATDKHTKNVKRKLKKYPNVSDEDRIFQDISEALSQNDLPHDIGMAGMTLRKLLKQAPEWRDKFGDKRVAKDAELLGDLLDGTLTEEEGLIYMAFSIAKGDSGIGDDAEDFLADK